jgi:polyphosphate kinase
MKPPAPDNSATRLPATGLGECDPQGCALFLNRELSWLEFNRRVLHEALDERTPLLERVGFLAIFNSNLDEYFQKRVGGLKRQVEARVSKRSPDGLTASEQIAVIREAVIPMLRLQADCFEKVVKPGLIEQGIHLLKWDQLDDEQRGRASEYFRRDLFPVLTPLAVDPGHPFPFISNLSTSMGVLLSDPHQEDKRAKDRSGSQDNGENMDEGSRYCFARVKVPAVLPGWVRLDGENAKEDGQGHLFVNLEQIIRHNLGELFQGMKIIEAQPFRVTRNADVERDEEDAEDLLELIEQELRDRRFAQAVRLEVSDDPGRPMNRLLAEQLDLRDQEIYQMPGELEFTDLWAIHSLNKPELKFEPWKPVVPQRLADTEADIFGIIRAGDVLVHHPYESFGASVERFIHAAATDPKVIAIKLTLYRTSGDSPFIPDIIRAAESGKQVVCLVELKARFDEERNVQLAHRLEKAGVHVVYGVVGLKTHTKTSLVVRHESDGMRCYAHIGTGNYHSKTASLYTDLSLFTADPLITGDLVELFHYLTGMSQERRFKKLLIAPTNLRSRMIGMIDREIEHCKNWHGRGADRNDPNRPMIIAKMNSLEDRAIIRKLYEASQAGVLIRLIVRGFCTLRPGVPGLSDNITVQSVIGRFLEHSRIFHFHNDDAGEGSAEYYIGSADWMYRNLDNRVECITPITDPVLQARLKQVLDILLADRRQAWEMQADGIYVQRQPDPTDADSAIGTHQRLMDLARKESAPQAVEPK